MFHDATFSEVERREAAGTAAEFVMDQDAFRGFYERNARGLWAYLYRVTGGDRTLAEDLLQETFYRFLRAGGNYESEAHRRNSVYRIATNLAHDFRRKRAAEAVGDSIESVASPGASAAGNPDLNKAMSQLSERERSMLWLAYAEGATHREITDVLGLRVGSLKMLLFRSRRKLAALLTPGKGGNAK